MKTAEEQLTEVRVAYIKKLYQGQPEATISRAIGDIPYMNFSSVEDFETWAQDRFQNDPTRQASEQELDSILAHMGLGGVAGDPRTQEEKNIDDIMSHL